MKSTYIQKFKNAEPTLTQGKSDFFKSGVEWATNKADLFTVRNTWKKTLDMLEELGNRCRESANNRKDNDNLMKDFDLGIVLACEYFLENFDTRN